MDLSTPTSALPQPVQLSAPFSLIALNAQQHEPLWRQLFNQLCDMMGDGSLKQGMSMPAERDMAEALGVSRITVKRCYDELRRRGVLAGRGRAGSVVQDCETMLPQHVQPTMGRLKGFTEEMRELGMEASTRLLRLQVVDDRRIASIFGRPSGAQFLHVVRIRLGDGVAMTRELAWYDLLAAPALAKWNGEGSAYSWLREHCGLALTHAEQTVEAVLSSPDESSAFGYEGAQPCLLLKRRTYAAPQTLVEYVEGTFRGDAYVYRTNLTV